MKRAEAQYRRTSPGALRAFVLAASLCAALLPLGMSCKADSSSEDGENSYFITGAREEREVLRNLFALLRDEEDRGVQDEEASRFTLVREIANQYSRRGEYGKLITFLTGWTNSHPGDPYNAYYLLMTAYGYIKQDAYPVAALYFERILKNYPDLSVRGESIHFICLRELIPLVDNSEQQVWYYEELISRFSEQINLGQTWFLLGQAYERLGEWDKAIAAYSEMRPYYGLTVPGFADAYNYAMRLVDFNASQKDWTFESLPALLTRIKSLLDERNTRRLSQYQAKVNFFTRSWAQQENDDSAAEFRLSSLNAAKLYYADELSPGSNANEAYLKTWGWSQFTSVWYFYFRKVYFPPDPEIHGRWEWAGIYYGERF